VLIFYFNANWSELFEYNHVLKNLIPFCIRKKNKILLITTCITCLIYTISIHLSYENNMKHYIHTKHMECNYFLLSSKFDMLTIKVLALHCLFVIHTLFCCYQKLIHWTNFRVEKERLWTWKRCNVESIIIWVATNMSKIYIGWSNCCARGATRCDKRTQAKQPSEWTLTWWQFHTIFSLSLMWLVMTTVCTEKIHSIKLIHIYKSKVGFEPCVLNLIYKWFVKNQKRRKTS
jgi:hypothetical protein